MLYDCTLMEKKNEKKKQKTPGKDSQNLHKNTRAGVLL